MFSALDAKLSSSLCLNITRLIYTTDCRPGIRRVKTKSGFTFISVAGRPFSSPRALQRLHMLAIPPAWQNVWICPNPRGHLQATGRDQRGRKQYIYHPLWRATRDQAKYERLIEFAERLTLLRKRVDRDLRRPTLCKEKVLATIVYLLQSTLIRVGNEEYAKQNGSHGLTTLRNKHVSIEGEHIRFQFRGKSGVKHAIDLNNRRLARIIKQCQDLPGQELFQYQADSGELHPVTSCDVNAYLRAEMGHDFTAKDFRTWAGTVLMAVMLRTAEPHQNQSHGKRQITAAIKNVARRLGNTAAICRKCYVHPDIITAYCAGRLANCDNDLAGGPRAKKLARLSGDEMAVYRLLQAMSAERARQNAMQPKP